MTRPGRTWRHAACCLALTLLSLLFWSPPVSALQQAPTLGPTPVQADCLTWHSDSQGCFYAVRSMSYSLSRHILHVGDTVTATAYHTPYFDFQWGWSGAPTGTTKVRCQPEFPSATDTSGTCTYKAISPTGGWRPGPEASGQSAASGIFFGAALYCCTIGRYIAGDYVAVLGDQEAISGYTRDRDAKPAAGALILINGTDKDGNAVTNLFTRSDQNGEYNALLKKGSYTVQAYWKNAPLCLTANVSSCRKSVTLSPTATADWRENTLGRIIGKVVDLQGQPAGKIPISIKDSTGREVGLGISKDDGTYHVDFLKPGTYTVGPGRATLALAPSTRTVQIQAEEDQTADFTLKELKLRGTTRNLAGKGTPAKVAVEGTDADGKAVKKDVTSGADGRYEVVLDPGTYTVTAKGTNPAFPPALEPSTCSGKSADGTCKITLKNADGQADFAFKCEQTLDFHTSMVAEGCFVPLDREKRKYKAKGSFRLDGLNFEALEEESKPVVFDTVLKKVDGDDVKFWISLAASANFEKITGNKFLAHSVNIHRTFATSNTDWIMQLLAPLVSIRNWYVGGALPQTFVRTGPFADGADPSLFGFPNHAPAIGVSMTSGKTTLTVQISFPTRSDSFIDPVNGLWKKPTPGGPRIDYPNGVKATAVATNDGGVNFIDITLSPTDVYEVVKKPKFIFKNTGKPTEGAVELAKVRLGYHIDTGAFDVEGTFVKHDAPDSKALGEVVGKVLPESVAKFLDFQFSRKVLALRGTWQWMLDPEHAGLASLIPTSLGGNVNGLQQEIMYGFFLQRAGLNVTYPGGGPWNLRFGGNLGFSWLPRFKSDALWFQEGVSIDGTGEFSFNPLTAAALTGQVKVLNATILNGLLNVVPSSGITASGTLEFDLHQLLRLPFAQHFSADYRGTGTISWPWNGGWTASGDVYARFAHYAGQGQFLWNQDGMFVCEQRAGSILGHEYNDRIGVVVDGPLSWHMANCDDLPLQSAQSAGIPASGQGTDPSAGGKEASDVASAAAAGPPRFHLSVPGRLGMVAVKGKGAAPSLTVTEPGGRTVSTAGPGYDDRVTLIQDPSNHTTYLMLDRPLAGDYRFALLPGSATIRSVRFARTAPPVRAHAAIRALGCRKALTWRINKVAGQTVQFVEKGKGTLERILVKSNRASGRFVFSPRSDAAGRRQVVMRVLQQGLPRLVRVIASYRVGLFSRQRVRGLRARLLRGRVNLSWAPVCGAAAYVIRVRTGRHTKYLGVRGTHASVPGRRRSRVGVSAGSFTGALTGYTTKVVR